MRRSISIAAVGLLMINLVLSVPAVATSKQQADKGSQKPKNSQAQQTAPNRGKADTKQQTTPKPDRTIHKQSRANSSTQVKHQTKMPAQDPPGNNGTVKIDNKPFDTHPNNQPHVGCEFQVDFYGFDKGNYYADVVFDAHSPTNGGILLTDSVFIGADAAGGGTDLDAEQTYNLADALSTIAPHPKQGHHVKLTTHAESSIGADTKHKVFWVKGCTTPTTPPGGQGGGTPPVPHTPSNITSMGGGNLLVAAAAIPSATIAQGIGGAALPQTGSMLDIIFAAILALGFAVACQAAEKWRQHRL